MPGWHVHIVSVSDLPTKYDRSIDPICLDWSFDQSTSHQLSFSQPPSQCVCVSNGDLFTLGCAECTYI